MTIETAAEAHEPIWAAARDPHFSDERALAGCSCGEAPSADLYGPSWFGCHVTDLGAPDYIQLYWKTWSHVEAPTGAIDRDAVARELFDFSFIMDQVSTVYCELADLSKPNYHAHAILGVINDRQEKHYREHYAERLCERADEVDNDAVRAELLQLAEEWSPGSWDEYQRGLEMIARFRAERAS